MLAELTADFARPRTSVYDIGGATSSALAWLDQRCAAADVRFIHIAESVERSPEHRERRSELACPRRVTRVQADFSDGLTLRNASVAIMAMRLGRTRPSTAAALLTDIHRGLNKGGCLLIAETMRRRSSLLNNIFATHRDERWIEGSRVPSVPSRGVALEIASAHTFEETCAMLAQAGFRAVEVFFEWYGVCGMAALK